MVTQLKTRAFLIELQPYRETSSLLQAFTPGEGRLSLVARGNIGGKGKKQSGLEPFSLIHVTCALREDASIATLQKLEIERVYQSLRESLECYAIANYWFDILKHALQPGLAAPELFSITDKFLDELEHSRAIGIHQVWQINRALENLGFGLNASRCNSCGSTGRLSHIELSSGTAICGQCALPGVDYYPLDERISPILPEAFGSYPPGCKKATPKKTIRLLLHLVNSLVTVHFEQPLRSWSFLEPLL
jgi:DNA repair protein RecO (recombination protein O)